MTPQFRFTIRHTVLAPSGTVVQEPIGWKEATLTLQRDPNFYSLVEHFEGDFVWFGSARNLLRAIENLDGPDGQAEILIDIRYSTSQPYERLYNGLFELSEIQDIDNDGAVPYKCTVPIIRNDFWAKFMNRRGSMVDLQSVNDLDGQARQVLTPTDLALPSQKIRQTFQGKSAINDPDPYLVQYDIPAGSVACLDIFNVLTLDEIAERVSAGTDVSIPPTANIFKLKYAGNYRFNIAVYVWGAAFTYQVSPDVNAFIQFNEGTPVALTRTDLGTDFVDGVTLFELVNYDFVAVPGTIVRLYLYNSNGFSLNKPAKIPSNNLIDFYACTMSIVGDTTYNDTSCDAFPVHEAFNSVLDRIISRDLTLYSEYLGNPDTQQITYGDFGCGSAYALAKGIHIRSYPLVTKPFFASFDLLWAGLNPLLNLGLGQGVLPTPTFIQFLVNTLILGFDAQSIWYNDGAGNDWSEGGGGQCGCSVGVGIGTKNLTQDFATKPAGSDYTIHFLIVTNAVGDEVTFRVRTYLDGVLAETVHNASYIGTGSTPGVLDIAFTSTLPFNSFGIDVIGVDPAPHPTTIELVIALCEFSELIADAPVIRIEPKRYFFNTTVVVNISNARLIRTYNLNQVIKNIEIGFAKWSVESASGIDDPQAKHTYNTKFKTVGKDFKTLSTFIGASLAIEQTRRQQSLEIGKDWQLDNDICIIALNKSTLDEPELDENFTFITDLLNSDTRYNIRLSVARITQRWLDFFSGCLQWWAATSKFYLLFSGGEGNFAMTTTMDAGDCEGDGVSLAENQNILATADFLAKPVKYDYDKCPMTFSTYKTIRNNPNNAIGLSRSDTGHKINHIEKLAWRICDGEAKIQTWLGETDPVDE